MIFFYTLSDRESKIFLRFSLECISELLIRGERCFLQLNSDEFNELEEFSSERIIQFIRNAPQFPAILQLGLKEVRHLNNDEFNNLFKLKSFIIEGLKNFFPEHIPLLLATENLQKTNKILSFVCFNKEVSLVVPTQYIPQLLRFPFGTMTDLLIKNQQARLPFLQLDDGEFDEFQKFPPDRMEKLIWSGKIFPAVLQLGLKEVRQLDDELFNNLFILEHYSVTKELKNFFPENIPLLLATENLEKTIRILSFVCFNKQESLLFPAQHIPQLLRFPFDTMTDLLYSKDQQTLLPFLQLDDDEFNEFQKRMESVIWNNKIFPVILQLGLKNVARLDDELFNTHKVLKLEEIQQLKELPFPQVEAFLKLGYQRDSLPFDLEQFKQYKGEKQNLPQENPPEVPNTSSKHQFEPDSK